MKAFLVAVLAVVAIALAAPAVHASALEKEMEVIGKATKGLKRLDGDFAKGEKLAAEALEAAKKSKELVPTMVEKMPDGAEKTAAIEAYKKQMDALIAGFEAVARACKDKDAAKFQEAFEALGPMKKEGHTQFMEEDEE
jgi:hypothetical protein